MLADWLGGNPGFCHTWSRAFSLQRILGKFAPLRLWPSGMGWGQSQEPSLPGPHPRRACGQEKDDPLVSESSFHLQLGANSIAGSNLIFHWCLSPLPADIKTLFI